MTKVNMKNILIMLSGILLILFIFCEVKAESNRCLGVQVVTNEEFGPYKNQRIDIQENLIAYEGVLTAFDEESRTIYIPYNITENTSFYNMKGNLESTLPEFELYFLREDNFDNMYHSVKSGRSFKLYAINSDGNYTSYQVIFTTLPVVEMHGEFTGADERERDYFEGQIAVWDIADSSTGRNVVQTSDLEWHVRGGSSRGYPKKSWKLSLKDKNGENNDLSFVGLAADDDYILNAMFLDDVKVREKLAISLWNEMMEEQKSSYKMTDAVYCEVIVNGDYKGLYLLQKRIDKKYLNLGEDDILLKGKTEGDRSCPEDVFDITYAKEDAETVYRQMDSFVKEADYSKISVSNFIDVSLMMHLGNMIDNTYQKNIFYIVDRNGKEESINLILWDTDLSFGIAATAEGFVHTPENVESLCYRMEYAGMLAQHPEMEELMKDRWWELRETTFSDENIYGILDEHIGELIACNVLNRDYEAVGWHVWENDNIQSLKNYIARRLEVLDTFYAQ